MYLDINGFLQNVRPNHSHHHIPDDYAFNHVKIEGDKEGAVYNLFIDDELKQLMEKMSQKALKITQHSALASTVR